MNRVHEWLGANGWLLNLLWVLGTAAISVLTRRRTAEEWRELRERSPRLAGLAMFLRAAGLDAPRLGMGLALLLRGRAPLPLPEPEKPPGDDGTDTSSGGPS